MKILVVNNAEPHIGAFARTVANIVAETGVEAVSAEYVDCPNIDLELFDGVILSGSPQGDDIVEHHLPYYLWVKNCEKPVFGICAGHHIAGYLFGARLLRGEEPESGDFEVSILKDDPLFEGLPSLFKVRQMHNDSITLPENFELLATSSTCRNQLMKHREKPLYTSQFHPEYYNHDLLRNFIGLCRRAKKIKPPAV